MQFEHVCSTICIREWNVAEHQDLPPEFLRTPSICAKNSVLTRLELSDSPPNEISKENPLC